MGLDGVELLIATEETFGLTIPDDRASEMRTVGDLFAFVIECRELGEWDPQQAHCPVCRYSTNQLTQPVCPECGAPVAIAKDMPDELVWMVVRRLVSEQLGIREENILIHSRFNEDLHMD